MDRWTSTHRYMMIYVIKSNRTPAPGKKVNGTMFTNVEHKSETICENNMPRAACLMQLGSLGP